MTDATEQPKPKRRPPTPSVVFRCFPCGESYRPKAPRSWASHSREVGDLGWRIMPTAKAPHSYALHCGACAGSHLATEGVG